jgi:hypothetical protein
MKTYLIAAFAVTLAPQAWAGEPATQAQDSAQQGHGDHGAAQHDKEGDKRSSPDATQVNNDPNRVICRRQDVVGTRLAKKRVCATAAEWERIHAEERQATERIQRERSKSN